MNERGTRGSTAERSWAATSRLRKASDGLREADGKR